MKAALVLKTHRKSFPKLQVWLRKDACRIESLKEIIVSNDLS